METIVLVMAIILPNYCLDWMYLPQFIVHYFFFIILISFLNYPLTNCCLIDLIIAFLIKYFFFIESTFFKYFMVKHQTMIHFHLTYLWIFVLEILFILFNLSFLSFNLIKARNSKISNIILIKVVDNLFEISFCSPYFLSPQIPL